MNAQMLRTGRPLRGLLALVALLLPSTGRAEDWPQFLGPRRDGTSKEIIAPWTGEPRVVWRVPVGEGHSSPVVAGAFVFLHDKVAGENVERLAAFIAADGKTLAEMTHPRGEF